MPRFSIHRSPKDDSRDDTIVDFEIGTTPPKRRRGLLSRFKETAPEPAAPWEIETEPTEAAPASRHDRNVPAASRRRRDTGAGPRAAAPSSEARVPVDISGSVGRLRSTGRIPAVAHDGGDTGDPWADSIGGRGYDAEAILPPPPAPVPPDPIADSGEMGSEKSFEFQMDGGQFADYESNSFWESLPADEDEGAAAPPTSGTDPRSVERCEPLEQSAGREDPLSDDSGFLGAADDFDMDIGFTHDSVTDTSLDALNETSFDDLSHTGGGPEPSLDPSLAPQATPANTPPEDRHPLPRGHDMSYPDIPALTVDDALARGRALMEAGQAEDALAILEMGLRMDPDHPGLKDWLIYAESRVLAEILPDVHADRVLQLLAEPVQTFADPRDARLVLSLIYPQTVTSLRAEHSGMSMREFAGRVRAMLSMGVFGWLE